MDSKAATAYPLLPSAPMEEQMAAPPSYDQATGSGYPPVGFQSPPVQQPMQQPPVAKYPTQQLPPGGIQYVPAPPVVQTVVMQAIVGPHSANLTCPSCQQVVKTRISHDSNSRTHLWALLCLIVCCPCACLPYCIDSCKSTNHYCPNCSAYIGTYSDRL